MCRILTFCDKKCRILTCWAVSKRLRALWAHIFLSWALSELWARGQEPFEHIFFSFERSNALWSVGKTPRALWAHISLSWALSDLWVRTLNATLLPTTKEQVQAERAKVEGTKVHLKNSYQEERRNLFRSWNKNLVWVQQLTLHASYSKLFTGWSKETVTINFSLANLKITKNGITQSFLESLYAAVLVF